MSDKKLLKRIISYVIVFVFLFQCTLGVYAANMDKNQISEKATKQIKKVLPKPAALKANSLHKLPPGLVKKEGAFERWKDKKEVVEDRTEHSKTYLNTDGTFTSAIFMNPIHIKDHKGKLIDIDNTLVPLKEGNKYAHRNKLGTFDAFFSGKESENGSIKVEKNNITIEVTSMDATTKDMIVEGNSVVYKGNRSGIEHLYTVGYNGIKEDVILYQSIDDPIFSYELDVKGPAEVVQQEGMIYVIDKKTGNHVFVLSAPFMEDNDGNQSFDVRLKLDSEKGKHRITLTADEQWLKDPERVYPVKIDPSITVANEEPTEPTEETEESKGEADIDDNFTQQKKLGYTHYDEHYIYVGYDDGDKSTNAGDAKGSTRGYIKFDIPDAVKQNEGIISAYINLYQYTGWGIDERPVDIWELPAGTSINSLEWENQPTPGTPIMTVSVAPSKQWHKWNALSLAKKWVTGPNNGIGIKMQDESDQAECVYSSNHDVDSELPYLEITYRTKPPIPIDAGDLELVLERNDIMENGTAYAKGTLSGGSPKSGENKATITYTLMPDGPSGSIEEENFDTIDWETEKFELDLDKSYWIEANIKLEHLIVPESTNPEIPPPPPYYEEVLNEEKISSKFVVGEAQPGDTLKRLAKHYLYDGTKYTEIKVLNKLTEEALIVGQKLFVITENSTALSYKQPQEITTEIELKDMASGSAPVNTEFVGQFINPHNGNFAYSNVDFGYSAYSLDIAMIRSHNSILENRKSPIGDNWDYSFNKYLFFHKDGTIGYNTGDGSRIYFKNVGGVYKTTAPVYDVLTDNGTYYELKVADNTRYQFGETGLLTKIIDKNNNETAVAYNGSDWQTTITDPTMRAISFTYFDTGSEWTGNISSVTMPNGASVKYTYAAGANTLEVYTDPDGYINGFTYDSNKRMKTLISGRNITSITNDYDGNGRVYKQYDGKQKPVSLTFSASKTSFTDGNGNNYSYNYNNKLWLTKKEYPYLYSESYTHNEKGDIKTRIDRINKLHQYDYNGLGFVTKYTRPDTKFMQYRYKNDNLLEFISDFQGNETKLYYDNSNNLDKEIKYVMDNGKRVEVVTEYSFTTQGLIASVADPDDVTTTFDNSQYPKEQKVSQEGNDPYHYFFDKMGRIITALDPKGYETKTTYDNRGNARIVNYPSTDTVKRNTEYIYDENGNLESETSSRLVPDGSGYPSTEYQYDNNDNLSAIIDPYGDTTTYEYDNNGNLDWEKDQEAHKTDYGYDLLDRLKTIKHDGQTSTAYTYEYDALGNAKKVTEADGDWTEYTYDYNVNRIKTISKPEGYSVTYDYDNMGNIKTETLPDDNTIDYMYDDLYRVKTIKEPGNKITNVDYKNSGRVKKIEDYTHKTFSYEYYPDGQLEKTDESYRDPITSETMNYEMVYTYDDNGNMKTITDEDDRTTTYNYNELNKVSKEVDPLKKTKSYSYDEDGNVSGTKDGEDNITEMQYDALNRLYQVRIPANADTYAMASNFMRTAGTSEEDTVHTYLYNSRGMLEYYNDPMDNLTTYSYNPLGKLEIISNAKSEEVKYQYYPDGTLKKVVYPNQQFEEYRYDDLNRAVWTKDRAGIEQTVDYTVTGQPDLISDNVGNKLDYQYDELGRVESIKDVLNRTEIYTYDSVGNVQAVKGMDNTTTQYTYDPRGRIRMVLDPEDKTTIMEYNGQNQVVQVEKPGSRIYTYDYDNSGNLRGVVDPAQNKTEYLYNNNNQVKEIVDARGFSKKYEYNSLNKLKKVVNERNYPTSYEYYPGGHLKTVKDSKGFETNYQYDDLNRIKIIENPLEEKITYDYDSMGNVDKMVDARGVTTRYNYNARDQVEYTYDTKDNRTIRQYYPNGDLEKFIDEESRATSYQYDEVHRITKLMESGGYDKNYVYNPSSGDIDRMYDNAGKSTVYDYDDVHRLLTETTEQGHLTAYTYDDFGNLETKKTPDGNVVIYSYDVLDRVATILDPESKLTEINYDPMGNIDYVIKPENQKFTYSYDPANNVEKIIDPLGQATIYTYDPNDNIATMLDPSGNLFNYNFDALNRLESVIDTTNSGSQYHYDASGNIDSITDGNNNKTLYGYDNLNRLEWVTDGENNTTSYTYFNDGKLKSMTDANGETSNYTYDNAGNLASFKNPLGETKSFQYTLLNQIKNVTNPDGKEVNYAYDNFNRLDNISYAGGDTVEYAYDDLNRKIGMADKNGVSEYEYDDMGRLTWVSDAAGEEVSYEYDEKGRKTKIIYPDGKFVTYGYDGHDGLETVTDREGRVTSYTYDNAGRRKTTKYPNGITTTYTYDKANRIVEIDSESSSGSTVEKLSYGYDGAGNKTKEEIWKEDKHYLREYTYYKNNTVKSMEESGDNDTEYIYEYDAAGNIVEKVVKKDGVSIKYNYIYNEANRMIEEKENEITSRLYRYDARGNRTEVVISAGEEVVEEEVIEETTETASKGKSKSKGGAVAEEAVEAEEVKEEVDTYYYDDADRLVEIVEHNGKQFTYGYDGEGNRLWRTYSQTPVIKEGLPILEPGVDGKGKGKENAPGQNKDKDNGNGNGKKTGAIDGDTLEVASASLSQMVLAAAEKSNNGKGNEKDNGNSGNNSDDSNGKDKEEDKDNGNDKDKEEDEGNDNSNGNGKDKENGNGNSKDKDNSNDKDKLDNGKGKSKNLEHKGKGWAKAHEKSKAKTNRGKHLGWYKKITHPNNPDGIEITEPEVFEVTNYINDINRENTEVLMTSDVDGNYWGAYTYGTERISAEDLVSIEGKPNNPLYYLHDALGTTTSVTNMNAGVIDSNRFAPYGEPIDPVAKNSRRTNSSFGFTGEAHGIEEGLVYLRARYYEPDTMRFLQQDTLFGDTMEPMTRNLYIYGNANPMTYVDPSGHEAIVEVNPDGDLILYNERNGNVYNSRTREIIEHIEPKNKNTDKTENKKPCTTIAEFKVEYEDLINEYAKKLSADPNVLGAIVFTESGGGGFYENGTLKIRFEEHIFTGKMFGTGKYSEYFIHSSTAYSKESYRTSLDGAWHKTHISGKQQISEYGAFEFAKTLDEDKAYEAISMGFGQIMGFNHKVLGYDSAKEMFDDFSKSERQQIIGMMKFIENYNPKMLKALQENDFKTFGLYYNGDSNYGNKVKGNISIYRNTK